MAVPLVCGLVPKASFSAVVTSSYGVRAGMGRQRKEEEGEGGRKEWRESV